MAINSRQVMAGVLDVWNGAAPDGLQSLLAPGYRGHSLGVAGGERDAAAYPETIARFRDRTPGVVFTVVEQLEAGDRLVSRLEARRSDAASGASLISHGMNIARFDDTGRLAEEWAIWSAWLEDSAQQAGT